MPSEPDDLSSLRDKIIGLGERSVRKSYYPQLQQHLRYLEEKSAALLNMLEDLEESRKRLQESEERYRDVVETQTELICRFLPDGTITFVNEAYCRYFDLDRGVVIGQRFKPDIHPHDIREVSRFFRSLTPARPAGSIEQRTIMPDGSTRWQKWSTRALFDTTGTIREFQSVGRDITGQKEAEERIREYQRRESDIINFLPDATFVIDRDGVVIAWNRAMEELTGIPADEMLGKANYEYAIAIYGERRPILADLILRDDPAIGALYPYISRKGETLISESVTSFPGKGDVAIWFTASPLYNSDGRVTGAIESIRDITDWKRAEEELLRKNEELESSYEEITATEEELRQQYEQIAASEEALRESEEKYRLINESSHDFMYSYDLSGRFTSANRSLCSALGRSPDQVIGKTHEELGFPAEQCRDWEELHQQVLTTHSTVIADTETPLPDGRHRRYEVILNPIHDRGGETIGIAGISRDITERKRAEEALERAHQKLRILSSITRHDIRNKIMVIQGCLDLAGDVVTDSALAEYLKRIGDETADILTQIEFTREYDRLGGREPTWLSVPEQIEKIVDSDLLIACECSGIEVFADPMIGKVFANLIDNTRRHAPGASHVRIGCTETVTGLCITYEDDGPGIPDDEKDLIFDHEYGRHTGMGLFLAREILAITGISITECGVCGEGARFEISVPQGAYRIIPEKTGMD